MCIRAQSSSAAAAAAAAADVASAAAAAAADCTHAPGAYLASEHERQGPVAADDLTLAHDRRQTLEVPDRQRHESGASAADGQRGAELDGPPER